MIKTVEFNEQFSKALDLMENTDKNVLIVGRAGTGKSTLLNYFRNNTKKKIAVLAPTGVAAVNIKGQTIHSFFNFKPDITLSSVKDVKPKNKEIYKKLDAIVIDEVSMVRADLFDCINEFLKIHGKQPGEPFGGIQLILIGDLYQLPPVVTSYEKKFFSQIYKSPFFFDSISFNEAEFEFVELEKVYRQKDEKFIKLLNAIRNKTIEEKDLEELNKRYIPDFEPDEKEFYVYLTTTNELADIINHQKLEKLKGKKYVYHGYIEGDFSERDLPAPLELVIKKGTQVMLLNNDYQGRWINGSMGRVVDIEKVKENEDIIWVELEDGEEVPVQPNKWDMFEFYYDKTQKKIKSRTVGSYYQYPLKPAWAITIHKSQGLTFDKVIIEIGKGTFSHGQLYVALSRCRSLEGLVLKKPISKEHIWLDKRVVNFLTKYQYKLSSKKLPLEEKIEIIKKAISEKKPIEIVYLKSKDVKSKRVIIPKKIGKMDYNGTEFLGVEGFCTIRKDDRVFNVEKILEIKEIE